MECCSSPGMYFFSCSVEENPDKTSGESKTNEKLRLEVDSLNWQLSRMALKIRSVDGGRLVRDKATNLWHYDVERVPFTGRALEYQKNDLPLAEAYFLNGKEMVLRGFGFQTEKSKTRAIGLTDKETVFFGHGMIKGILYQLRDTRRVI